MSDTVKLYRTEYRQELYRMPEGDHAYLGEPYIIETDYTGRWKIVNADNVGELYLECFELVDQVYYVGDNVIEQVKIYDTFWAFISGGRWIDKIVEKRIAKSRLRANVTWNSDKALKLVIETINECTECEQYDREENIFGSGRSVSD